MNDDGRTQVTQSCFRIGALVTRVQNDFRENPGLMLTLARDGEA